MKFKRTTLLATAVAVTPLSLHAQDETQAPEGGDDSDLQTVVVTGVEIPKRFEWTPLYFKEIALIGSNAFGVEELDGRRAHAFELYLDLVRAGRVDGTPILTHRFRLRDYRAALLACGNQGASGAVKVLFDFGDG